MTSIFLYSVNVITICLITEILSKFQPSIILVQKASHHDLLSQFHLLATCYVVEKDIQDKMK